MQGFKGTPGPWFASKTDRGVGPISRSDDQSFGMIIEVAFIEYDTDIDVQISNANLIAAAPELLEALQLAKHVIENMLPANSASRTRVSQLAGKAIKKALGD